MNITLKTVYYEYSRPILDVKIKSRECEIINFESYLKKAKFQKDQALVDDKTSALDELSIVKWKRWLPPDKPPPPK